MLSEQTVRNAVAVVQDPELKKSLLELGMIRDISIEDGRISLTLALTTSKCPKKNAMVEEIKQVLEALPEVANVEVQLTTLSQKELQDLFPQHPLQGVEKVQHVLAVASGKGGVGKTTIAINIALALAAEGNRVGILDADVYGPSVAVMLGLHDAPEWENRMIIPVQKFGLQVMSLGMLSKEGQALIWRGPMVGKAINQLLGQVMWGELDYLVVDLPPGTGDPSITVAQSIPKAAVLIVTTPQEVALADVRRAVELFRKYDLNIVGLVENMSYFMCGHTSEPIEIFGHGGGAKLSEELGLPLLGAVPIELQIRVSGDSGVPLMVSAADSEAGHIFQTIARKILAEVNRP
ncbi:MAG: chromosome partitioning protein [Desulfuromonadales bacterium C00003093]|nr:MAG: chromosome partitioning protein [Desulfuromonadales bacterium C00003093]